MRGLATFLVALACGAAAASCAPDLTRDEFVRRYEAHMARLPGRRVFLDGMREYFPTDYERMMDRLYARYREAGRRETASGDGGIYSGSVDAINARVDAGRHHVARAPTEDLVAYTRASRLVWGLARASPAACRAHIEQDPNGLSAPLREARARLQVAVWRAYRNGMARPVARDYRRLSEVDRTMLAGAVVAQGASAEVWRMIREPDLHVNTPEQRCEWAYWFETGVTAQPAEDAARIEAHMITAAGPAPP